MPVLHYVGLFTVCAALGFSVTTVLLLLFKRRVKG